MRHHSLKNVRVAYAGTLGVTTEKGQQDVKPLVLDHTFDGYDLALLRWETGVFEVDSPPPAEPEPLLAPVNLVRPPVPNGLAIVGSPLSIINYGLWSGSPNFSVLWYRANPIYSGTDLVMDGSYFVYDNLALIPSQTGIVYFLSPADQGKFVFARITGFNTEGASSADSLTSAVVT